MCRISRIGKGESRDRLVIARGCREMVSKLMGMRFLYRVMVVQFCTTKNHRIVHFKWVNYILIKLSLKKYRKKNLHTSRLLMDALKAL